MERVSRRALLALVAVVAMVASFVVPIPPAAAAPGDIVISELNYHAGSDLDEDDFIELANASASPIDVSGYSFTSGITATLPPGTIVPAGGYIVISKDAAQFEAVHGFAPDAVYSGNLSNGGETVTLMDGATVIDSVSYLDEDPWTPLPDGNGPSLELRDLSFDNSVPENWGPSEVDGGTARAVNSINGTSPPSKVLDATAVPFRPAPGETIEVSAELPSGSTATVAYKVMFGADVDVPMLDDAASPGGAGDGVFSATIPGQAAGELVRWRIDAVRLGQPFSHPAADDSINYEGVVVTDPAVNSQIPVVDWFMEDSVYDDILDNHRYEKFYGDAVIAYDGLVIDNAQMRIRGQSSRSLPKVNWKVELPAGKTLDLRPQIPDPVDEFALQRDTAPLANLGWETVGDAGNHRLGIFAVRSQRNGEFWGVSQLMELMDGTWRDAKGVDEWALYKGDAGALATESSPEELQNQMARGCPLCPLEPFLDKKTREDEDYTDVWELTQAIDAPASAAKRAWMFENLNIPELVNYMAINTTIRHQDSNWKNWYVAHDTEGTGRWEMWHWDLNWIFTTDGEDHKGEFLSPAGQNRLLSSLMEDPEIAAMFYRRVRTLADEFLVPGRYEAAWDALTQPYEAEWALDYAAWGGRDFELGRVKFIQGITDRRTVIANNSGPGGLVPPSQSADPIVVINEIQYDPAASGSEFLEVMNPSLTESVDLSGWTFEGVDLTVQPGTILLPGAHAVFVDDDVEFRQAYPGGDRLVAGQYSGGLSNSGETIRLLDGARIVDEVTYSSVAPWPVAAAGTGPSLELIAPSADNALPGSWNANAAAGGTPGLPNTVGTPDNVSPTVPSGLTASGTTDVETTLAWTASTDNVGVAGYEIARNGVMIGSTTGTSFAVGGLAPSTPYDFTVRAFDDAGNRSAYSAATAVTTEAADPVLFADDFSGANGSAWRAEWVTASNNGAAERDGGTGVLSNLHQSGAWARAALTGVAPADDTDLLFSYEWNSGNRRAYFSAYTRGSGGWQNAYRPVNGYGVEITSDNANVALRRNVGGSTTTLDYSPNHSVGAARQWVRLRAVGSTIQYRIWADGTPEPTTWNVTVTDTQVTDAGQTYLSLVRSGSSVEAKSVRIDDFQLLDAGIPTPPDTEAPTVPAGLVASGVTTSAATVSWNAATDNIGVAGYEVSRDGVLLPGTVTGLSLSDSGLAAGTSYAYRVRAFDAAGNRSGFSAPLNVTTEVASPVLFSDDFSGTNGSPWSPAWTSSSNAANATIQDGRGRLEVANSSGSWVRSQLTGAPAVADSDLVFSFAWNSSAPKAYFNVWTRGSGGWSNAYRPQNGYGLQMRSDSGNVVFQRVVNGAVTNFDISSSNQVGSGRQWVRLRVVGSTVQYRTWEDGVAEPATWDVTVNDTSVTAPGQVFMSLVRSGSAIETKSISIDDLSITQL